MGLLDPATSDGRVIFFLPWEGGTIAGTTDAPAPVQSEPRAAEDEIRWVLEEVRRYLSPDIKVRRADVLSAWSGLRPLVRNPAANSTEGLVRNHMIYVSPSGLLTIAGGKWTTYRAMAEETVDEAVKAFGLEDRTTNGCVTESVRLVGSDAWTRNMFIGLIQKVRMLECPLPLDCRLRYVLFFCSMVSTRKSRNIYRTTTVTVPGPSSPSRNPPMKLTGSAFRRSIHVGACFPSPPTYPRRADHRPTVIEAEVRYAVRHEYALTATDVISRRLRLSFLNAQAAFEALPRVIDIMAKELNWDAARKQQEMTRTTRFLQSMGLPTGVVVPSLARTSSSSSQDWYDWALDVSRIKKVAGVAAAATVASNNGSSYGRAQFEVGEVDSLREAFVERARDPAGRLAKPAIRELLQGIPAYAGIRTKDFEYVLEETGLAEQKDVDVDEFVEVRSRPTTLPESH
jgi:glycerol-3-phosphate dehydrogenase